MGRFQIDRSDGITTVRLIDVPSADDVRRAIDEVAEGGESPLRLWIVEAGLTLESEQLRVLAEYGRERLPSPARLAIVAGADLAFGLSKIFQAYRETEAVESRVFRDVAEARSWLLEAARSRESG